MRTASRLPLLLALAACASTLDLRYFTLAPTLDAATRDGGPALAVGPVSMPDYLLRSELVRRIDEHRVVPLPDRHWAEPLDRGIQRVLAENLAARLATTRVTQFPDMLANDADYRITLQVHRFEARGAAVLASIDWTLLAGDSGERLAGAAFRQRRELDDVTSEAVTAGLSALLGALTEDIAAAIAAAGSASSAAGR